MSKYLNRLNIGMIICEEYSEINGRLANISGIKDKVELDSDGRATFALICDFNFIEFEIPKGVDVLSFRFFIRTIGEKPAYIIPFMISEMGISEQVNGVMTHQVSVMLNVDKFSFPQKGNYAIEIYKNYGHIDERKESKNIEYYRKNENFVNAINFAIV